MLDKSKIKAFNELKIGLVMSGGGAKGAYEGGVIAALYDLDLRDKVKAVSGTSIGALNTMLFATGDQKLCRELWNEKDVAGFMFKNGRVPSERRKEFLKFVNTGRGFPDFHSAISYIAAGNQSAFTLEGVRQFIQSCDIAPLWRDGRDYYVCAYNCERFEPEYFHLNECDYKRAVDCTLASAAIPYLFEPIVMDGIRYCDGGIAAPGSPDENADGTPFKPLLEKDLDILIGVHLREPSQVKTIPSTPEREVIDIVPTRSIEPVRGISAMNFTHSYLRDKYELGYRDAMSLLAPKIISWLKAAEEKKSLFKRS
ncbi:MAG TPA: patatin-like phospholipase family protein [Oscillospiraceae bacterium]|nr:patatin-like phospholipase family protein [Oscillospiraceae bacterium]HPF55533.1 patatin-like phospholipase family protein [Clostridiales bacterium]HPK35693.1 patatin-like phospholipase family protein [Oscillospiraceae bacterium]HPR76396.1 patatin-like phospholipase family protein [Oscillospiraceae bacterium]